MCNQKRFMLLLLTLVLMSTMLVGCNLFGGKNTDLTTGTLHITVNPLSPQESTITPLTVSDDITLNKYVVTVSKGTASVTKELPYSTSPQEVTFTNLAPGTWDVHVVAKDTNGYDCYGGNAVASVVNGESSVDVPVYLLNGNLDLTVKIPVAQIPGLTIERGTAKLVNPRSGESHVLKDLVVNGADALASFGPVKAGTWFMEVELFVGESQLAWGSGAMTVLPSRDNHAVIEFTDQIQGGDLKINVIINRSPNDPTGLTATFQTDKVTLKWNANPETNIAGYAIYRSTSLTGFKKILTYSLISGINYIDTTIQVGQNYYYWVQAYDANGYSSDFSDPCFIPTSQTPYTNINLGQYSSVIYVDGNNGSDSTGTGSALQPYQTVQKAYQNVVIDNTAVLVVSSGTYAIPQGLQSLLKDNLKVDYIVRPDLFGSVVFDLQNTQFNHLIQMSKYNCFIGIVFKRSGIGNPVSYEYFANTSAPKVNIYNCVFDKGVIVNFDFPIYPDSNTTTPKDIYFINCTFVPAFTSSDNNESPARLGNFKNCAFVKSDFTTDLWNLCGISLNPDYSITSAGWEHTAEGTNPDGTQANMGVYGGTYAWGEW